MVLPAPKSAAKWAPKCNEEAEDIKIDPSAKPQDQGPKEAPNVLKQLTKCSELEIDGDEVAEKPKGSASIGKPKWKETTASACGQNGRGKGKM